MNLSKISSTFLFTILLLFLFKIPARGESVLDEIRETRILKVAIREDAIPFGYRDNQGNFRGMCLDFIALLRQKILSEIDGTVITIRLVESNLFNRFTLVEDDLVQIECGPNTIRNNLKFHIKFSAPFFVTGTQFLVRKEEEKNIDLDNDLADISLGVLRNSSTELYLRKNYPKANIILFQGVRGRTRGVQAVVRGKIDAMVSDGILLLGETIVQGFAFDKNYVLLPNKPITCDYYGMILPQDDPEWENLVNSVIAEFKEDKNQWLDEISDYIDQTARYCSQE